MFFISADVTTVMLRGKRNIIQSNHSSLFMIRWDRFSMTQQVEMCLKVK